MEIRAVDPHDDAVVEAWHAAYRAADGHDRDHATTWRLEEMRVNLQAVEKGRRVTAWIGVDDAGEAVATGLLETQLLDNLSAAWLQVHTRPDRRGRGHGSAMLAFVEGAAADRGRTVLHTDTQWRWDDGRDGRGVPAVEWLERRGYRLALVDIQSELLLPVADGLLERLAAEAAPHHAAYSLTSWVGPVPDEMVTDFVALEATIATEAPTGGMQLEPESADVEDFRDGEATLARQGRVKYNTVARSAAGELAAYTDLVTSHFEDGRAYQWGTLVRPADRGHRLGLAVKVANLLQLRAARPDLTRLTTFNADVNQHMIEVNERLGFRPVEWMGELEKHLPR